MPRHIRPASVSGRRFVRLIAILGALAAGVSARAVGTAEAREGGSDRLWAGTAEPAPRRGVVAARPDAARRWWDDLTGKTRVPELIAASARATQLPGAFLGRLLRQESGLDPRAVSRVGAQGVAQFMPATAAQRGVANPFDPNEAIPKAAELLRELREEFGNLGLAAAAYNGGPARVRAWLSGKTALPLETERYVLAVTGQTASSWAPGGALAATGPVGGDGGFGGEIPLDQASARAAASRRHKPGAATTFAGGIQPFAAPPNQTLTLLKPVTGERALCDLLGGRDKSCVVQASY
ncbi:lytic transglycosylase domain-containing protein [Alsobacter sp. KACC 23698]|uniref:Lytic transglycosylase domain-containing protein n=1 Tax=Alsobacter sp. KACC 23698 TaxID=3149229 RepID=A0AAU7JJK1_9HYPH